MQHLQERVIAQSEELKRLQILLVQSLAEGTAITQPHRGILSHLSPCVMNVGSLGFFILPLRFCFLTPWHIQQKDSNGNPFLW